MDSRSIYNGSGEPIIMIRKNFSKNEWTCKCGCGQTIVVDKLADMMQEFRDIINLRVVVHCVNRCKEHNENLIKEGIKASRSSLHLEAKACDFHVPSLRIKKLHALVLAKDDLFNGGVGLYDWGVHVDIGRKRLWDSRRDTKW